MDGGASPCDTPLTPPDHPCTTCDGSLPPNPRLCGDRQSWDDFTHLIKCNAFKHAELDRSIFTTDKDDRRTHEDLSLQTMTDLHYQDLDQIQSLQ